MPIAVGNTIVRAEWEYAAAPWHSNTVNAIALSSLGDPFPPGFVNPEAFVSGELKSAVVSFEPRNPKHGPVAIRGETSIDTIRLEYAFGPQDLDSLAAAFAVVEEAHDSVFRSLSEAYDYGVTHSIVLRTRKWNGFTLHVPCIKWLLRHAGSDSEFKFLGLEKFVEDIEENRPHWKTISAKMAFHVCPKGTKDLSDELRYKNELVSSILVFAGSYVDLRHGLACVSANLKQLPPAAYIQILEKLASFEPSDTDDKAGTDAGTVPPAPPSPEPP